MEKSHHHLCVSHLALSPHSSSLYSIWKKKLFLLFEVFFFLPFLCPFILFVTQGGGLLCHQHVFTLAAICICLCCITKSVQHKSEEILLEMDLHYKMGTLYGDVHMLVLLAMAVLAYQRHI